ncbi:MAG: hypothetical protein AAGM84_18005 [Pseudomonadota bacterium]
MRNTGARAVNHFLTSDVQVLFHATSLVLEDRFGRAAEEGRKAGRAELNRGRPGNAGLPAWLDDLGDAFLTKG